MLFKRALALLVLALGFVGVSACVAGAYGVWLLGARLERANEKVFTALDKGLVSAQERLRGVQKRVEESKVTNNEIAQNLRDWTGGKARERLASRPEIEGRTEKLARDLETASSWLETATESIQGVQQVLELANLASARVDPAALDHVLEKLKPLQDVLQQAERAVDGIRELTANKESDWEENRLSRVIKLLGHMLLMISDIDTRLEEAVTRLSELRDNALRLKERTSNYILLAMIGCYVLLTWIGAGQAALCVGGWKNCCRSRSSA
jgi:hypothetical protein